MEGVAYLLAIDVSADVLAADKWELPIDDKDLVVVEMYLIIKSVG